jgi:luciferase family oxidoreductase group 1
MSNLPPLSILDLAFVTQGSTPGEALGRSVDLARHAEDWGYRRFWLAEHHNMVGIASAATSVVVGHIAGGTKTIRVGAGGIMLPNHSPLVIAEQFGTLEALYPGRIDLGLGRAPGTDQATMHALRRNLSVAENFPRDVVELMEYLGPADPVRKVHAVPGTGSNVPVWILGSSLFGAQLAARLGLPYAFASHFAPGDLVAALQVYRAEFRPSVHLDRPHAMVGVNAVVAETDAQARYLFTSIQQSFTNLLRGTRGRMLPPLDDIDNYWTTLEKERVEAMLLCSFVGSPGTVRAQLERFVRDTGADELMVASAVFDHAARLRSYQLLASLSG